MVSLLSCQHSGPKATPEKIRIIAACDKFIASFAAGQLTEAMLVLKQNSVIDSSAIDTMQATINSQQESIFTSYGKFVSHEFVVERTVKDFVARRYYIVRFDKYILKFDFTLYNNGKTWTITNFNYNDDLVELLY